LIEDIKIKALKQADEILNKKDNSVEIRHYEDNIIQATKRADADKIKQFEKSTYSLVNSIMNECPIDPFDMSVMQIYQKLEDNKKRNSKTKTK
jgi:hypothetical protein